MLPLAQLMPPGLTCDSVDVLEETISMASAAASFAIATRPVGSFLAYLAVDVPDTLTASTAVKFGIGTDADPDAYFLSAGLTSASSGQKGLFYINSNIATAETLKVFACATDGTAAGTIGGGSADAITVRVAWLKVEPV